MPTKGEKQQAWRKGKRLSVFIGHHPKNKAEPAVIIYDNATGLFTPLSVEATYRVADKLIDTAEQLEQRNT